MIPTKIILWYGIFYSYKSYKIIYRLFLSMIRSQYDLGFGCGDMRARFDLVRFEKVRSGFWLGDRRSRFDLVRVENAIGGWVLELRSRFDLVWVGNCDRGLGFGIAIALLFG